MIITRFHPSILREYDIRGVIGKTLSEKEATWIGQAYGSMLRRHYKKKDHTIAVGRDGRLSSPKIEAALIEGLNKAGINVVKLGLSPTPMLYFSVFHLDLDGGIMITGSHNPPDYNGFKMMLGKKSLFGKQILELGGIIEEENFLEGEGTVTSKNIVKDYIDRITENLKLEKDLKVAWDCGNGIAGHVIHELTQRIPGDHFMLYDDVDGTFPNHHPDPTVAENLVDIQNYVAKYKCDVGIAFDGDADRIGVVDNKGRILWGDQLLAILAKDVLKNHPSAAIIADVKASQILFDEVRKYGGDPIMWKTGHSLIKTKMQETGAKLAGEMSGHIFFADDYYGFDDALYAAIRLINILISSDKTLDEMFDELPTMINTPELRFDCEEERKFAIVDEVKKRLKASDANFNDVDGVRVMTDDGWWLLRASNTQAAIVARCESSDEDGLKRLKNQLLEQLDMSQVPVEDY